MIRTDEMLKRGLCTATLCLGLACLFLLAGCPDQHHKAPGWPIAKEVYTTAEEQVLPVALPADTPIINPADVSLYDQFGHSAWHFGPGTDYSSEGAVPQPYDKRVDLAPDYADAPNAARLLTFFAMTDIHITDKESPAQPIYPGWIAPYGKTSAGLFVSSYSPIILSTTQVLDAAVQTMNALNEQTPFDFGISLGDDINNNQYNELRWFIDVLDGKVITPSSGAHAGACDIDYQRPYKAAGLDKSIPWYQVIGNHDKKPGLDEGVLQHQFEARGPRVHASQPRRRLRLLHVRTQIGYSAQSHRAGRYEQAERNELQHSVRRLRGARSDTA